MANKYPGTCYKCGNPVAVGAGVFEKVTRQARAKWPGLCQSIRWQTQHHECVRDYDRMAHYIHNPKPPLYIDAKWLPK